jgi:hypothetical protein
MRLCIIALFSRKRDCWRNAGVQSFVPVLHNPSFIRKLRRVRLRGPTLNGIKVTLALKFRWADRRRKAASAGVAPPLPQHQQT